MSLFAREPSSPISRDHGMILKFGREYDPLMTEVFIPIYHITFTLLFLYWLPHFLIDNISHWTHSHPSRGMVELQTAYHNVGHFFSMSKLSIALHLYTFLFLTYVFFRRTYFPKLLPSLLYCNTFIWATSILSW